MAPGVQHCGVGAGPDSFNSAAGGLPPPPVKNAKDDLFSAIIDWSEKKKQPARVIATKFVAGKTGNVDLQRPLCAYPQVAQYEGVGATNMAEHFVCKAKMEPSG